MDLDGISYESPDFTKIIAPAIEQAPIFLFILTPNSQASRYARNELLLAKTRNKHVFIVEPYECEMTSEFILEYGHFNKNLYYIDYQRKKLYEEIARLLPQETHNNKQSSGSQIQNSVVKTISPNSVESNLQKAKISYGNKVYSEAFRLFKLAAEQGSPEAMFYLGRMLKRGKKYNITGNYDEAIRWYKKSADLGYPPAQKYIGDHYLNKSHDKALAIIWYKKAANQGDIDAQKALKELGF